MKFYVLEAPPRESQMCQEAGTWAARSDNYSSGSELRCPVCNRVISMLSWLPPYEADLDVWGTVFGDLAYKGSDEILVSQRFKTVYETSGITGLSTFDSVEIARVVRHRDMIGECPPYFRADIARSRAVIDQQASGFVWRNPPTCTECFVGDIIKRWNRLIIQADTWSGEDIFQPRGLARIIVTEKFKGFCESNALRNAYFVPTEDYSHDYYPWESVVDQQMFIH